MSRIGILILAAGASTRLGQPKQLVAYRGKPLIRHVAEVAIASRCQPVGVALGAYAESIKPHLADLGVHLLHNRQWSTGMASSIRFGLEEMVAIASGLDAIVLMVCDQPFVSSARIHQMVSTYQATNFPIVASEYAGILGVPALFHKTLFPELALLQGDVGARSILYQHRAHAISLPFTEGVFDLDRPQDVKILSPGFNFPTGDLR